MASKIEDLLARADIFLGNHTDRSIGYSLVRELVDVVRVYHPIVNPPVPLVENPNIVAWRPLVKDGLSKAVEELQLILGLHVKIESSTHIRRSVMKDGGIKARIGIKFKARTPMNYKLADPIKVIQRAVNETFDGNGLPKCVVQITCGSQMNFSARVYVEGDEDYERRARYN